MKQTQNSAFSDLDDADRAHKFKLTTNDLKHTCRLATSLHWLFSGEEGCNQTAWESTDMLPRINES